MWLFKKSSQSSDEANRNVALQVLDEISRYRGVIPIPSSELIDCFDDSYNRSKASITSASYGHDGFMATMQNFYEAEKSIVQYKKTYTVQLKHGLPAHLGNTLGFFFGAVQYGIATGIASFSNEEEYFGYKPVLYYCEQVAGTMKELHPGVKFHSIRDRVVKIANSSDMHKELLANIAGCFN